MRILVHLPLVVPIAAPEAGGVERLAVHVHLLSPVLALCLLLFGRDRLGLVVHLPLPEALAALVAGLPHVLVVRLVLAALAAAGLVVLVGHFKDLKDLFITFTT